MKAKHTTENQCKIDEIYLNPETQGKIIGDVQN